jgi:hypothetical protein
MSPQATNNLRLLGIGIILCSFVVPGPQIDSLANIAMIGLLADWAYRIISDTNR